MPPERTDAFDVITDDDLASRTASLRRNMALRLAAQNAYDSWYSYEDPDELAAALENKKLELSEVMYRRLLELSSSIDSEMLHVLRDVGVGSPQFGVAGMGSPMLPPRTDERASDIPTPPRRRGIFR